MVCCGRVTTKKPWCHFKACPVSLFALQVSLFDLSVTEIQHHFLRLLWTHLHGHLVCALIGNYFVLVLVLVSSVCVCVCVCLCACMHACVCVRTCACECVRTRERERGRGVKLTKRNKEISSKLPVDFRKYINQIIAETLYYWILWPSQHLHTWPTTPWSCQTFCLYFFNSSGVLMFQALVHHLSLFILARLPAPL